MPLSFRLLLVAVVLWTTGFWLTPARAQEVPTLEVEFVEHLVIGEDEGKPREYLFSGVRDIAVDADGNIFVADAKSAEIRMFSEEGQHRRTLGRRGQGPGEFQDVSALGVDGEGNVLVADRMNQRVTRFVKSRGYQPETFPLPLEQPAWIYELLPLRSGDVGLVYKVYGSAQAEQSTEVGDQGTELLHIYDSSFNEVVDATVPYADFYDPDDPFQRALTNTPSAHFSVDDKDNILVVPRFYEGVIYRYEYSGKGWTKHEWNGGYDPGYAAYELLDDPDYSSEDLPLGYMSISGSGGSFSAIKQKSSDGAFRLRDGRVIHFSRMGTGRERVVGVEVFTEDGELIGYGPVDGWTSTREEPIRLNVFTVDENDRFYLTDMKSGVPVVRVVSVEYTVEE